MSDLVKGIHFSGIITSYASQITGFMSQTI